MAGHDAELLRQFIESKFSQLTIVFDSRMANLEQKREDDARYQAERHGQNQALITGLGQQLDGVKTKMSIISGDDSMGGELKNMKQALRDGEERLDKKIDDVGKEVKALKDKMMWFFLGLAVQFGLMLIGYAMLKK